MSTAPAFSSWVSKTKVLLVDDDKKVTTMVASLLRGVGTYETREINDPATALEAAREFHPAIVILDVDMPGIDGGEVATQLRSDPQAGGATLIFMSGLVSPQEKGVRNGAIYLPKPCPLVLLHQILELIVAKRATLERKSEPEKAPKSARARRKSLTAA